MKRRAVISASWVLLLVACTQNPPPRVLQEVEQARAGAQSKEAEQLAPQAYRAAEQLRAAAERADNDGDHAGSQILGEHALTAYSRAFVLARLAKADKRLGDAKSRLDRARSELSALDAQQAQVSAEAEDLEMRVRVARDALPVAKNEPASADREKARLDTARSLALQARLLCASARLLSPDLEGLKAKFDALDALDKKLETPPKATPIDDAIKMRSECLAKLSLARRPSVRATPERSPGDELLAVLSEAKLEPFRDDRGVVVVLRGIYQGDALSTGGKDRVTTLGQIAREHSDTPVLVVVHGAHGASDHDRRRAAAVSDALRAAGATKVETQAAGALDPVVPPSNARAGDRNERTEVVFVTPGW